MHTHNVQIKLFAKILIILIYSDQSCSVQIFLHCRYFSQQWGEMEAASALFFGDPEEFWDGSEKHRGQGEGGSQLSRAVF